MKRGDTELKDRPRSGRPRSVVSDGNIDRVRKIVEENPRSSLQEIERRVVHKYQDHFEPAFEPAKDELEVDTQRAHRCSKAASSFVLQERSGNMGLALGQLGGSNRHW